MEKVDVWELARDGARIESELALGRATRLAGQLADADGALRFRMTWMTDGRGRPAATLDLAGSVRMRCDRCGGTVSVPIDEHAWFFFVADERELAGLPIDEAPEEPLLGSRHFDVLALIEDQAMLALPISPRHAQCSAPVDAVVGPADDAAPRRPFDALAALKRRAN